MLLAGQKRKKTRRKQMHKWENLNKYQNQIDENPVDRGQELFTFPHCGVRVHQFYKGGKKNTDLSIKSMVGCVHLYT